LEGRLRYLHAGLDVPECDSWLFSVGNGWSGWRQGLGRIVILRGLSLGPGRNRAKMAWFILILHFSTLGEDYDAEG
jgi:hypothetical protein